MKMIITQELKPRSKKRKHLVMYLQEKYEVEGEEKVTIAHLQLGKATYCIVSGKLTSIQIETDGIEMGLDSDSFPTELTIHESATTICL